MADRFVIDLSGHRELQAAMRALKDSVEKKIMVAAVKKGLLPILQAARAAVPVEHGLLKSSLERSVKAYRSGNVYGVVGPRSDVKGPKGEKPARYAHLVDRGTKPHAIVASRVMSDGTVVFGRKVTHPGSKASNFLTGAWAAQRDNGARILQQELWNGIAREARIHG